MVATRSILVLAMLAACHGGKATEADCQRAVARMYELPDERGPGDQTPAAMREAAQAAMHDIATELRAGRITARSVTDGTIKPADLDAAHAALQSVEMCVGEWTPAQAACAEHAATKTALDACDPAPKK